MSSGSEAAEEEAEMQQQKTSAIIAALVVVFTTCATDDSVYPKFSHVFNDPTNYTLLYSASEGPINETLRFTRSVRLTSVVLPSQIIDFANQSSYEENLSVRVFETVLNSNTALVTTTQLASGRISGNLRFGQEVPVLVHLDDGAGNVTSEQPVMAVFTDATHGSEYIINVSWGSTTGIYPWYSTRKFSSSASVHASSDVAGYMIGLSYTLL